MRIIQNPYRGSALPADIAYIRSEFEPNSNLVFSLVEKCPVYAVTPLISHKALAQDLQIKELLLKDERNRMGMSSFKALGATYVIARAAYDRDGEDADSQTLKGITYATASAGNHGLAVATGASLFGANSVIFLAETVPTSFKDSLERIGATVIVQGKDYAESMDAASEAAMQNGWELLSDSTWAGYNGGVGVMHGYLAIAQEIVDQVESPPTHVFLQAGVGGLAAALTAFFRKHWGTDTIIAVVEPVQAPAILESILAATPVITSGDDSIMGRLDCKEPSHVALKIVAHDADYFLTVSDDFVSNCVDKLNKAAVYTSPSGAAGFAGLEYARSIGQCKLDEQSTVLLVISEGVVSE